MKVPGDNSKTRTWKESVRFRFEDWGWVVINIGMGIGAGIAILPVEVGMKGFWVFMLASVIGYPSMYLFQRVFVNSLVEARSCNDYPGIISEYLGKNWGAAIGFLYFLMLIIWYFVYSETVIRDSASYLQTFGFSASNLSSNPLYIIGVISLLTFIAAIGEKLLFKLSSVLALTVLTIIFLMSLAMIPDWSTKNIAAPPGVITLSKDAIITLPFVLTSILFIQSLSPMVIFFRQHSDSKPAARFRSLRAVNLAFGILFVVVFFYANSFNLSISQSQATEAFKENVSALAIAAQGSKHLFVSILAVLLDIFAVICCFFSVFLGLKEGTRGLVLNLLKRFRAEEQVNKRLLDWIIAVFLVLLATGDTLVDIKILYFTWICSPIFGIVGCFVPAYLVYRLPQLHKYKGPHLYVIIFVGILLCLSPFLAI
ncbi:MAG: aromatic amino acid transport family protein [Pseudomonadota bacterium]|nr:hypothetical protein [Desulfobacterales bacterium]MBL7102628.1 hypothetical protein [Desulfobacteraceae bacterium]MBL7173964.1 hypothetical protein [Desulfobacteraceae bacterium]MBU0736417.1 hypothetical protein [Pseudomonadota bacterium]